jgi:hypothetical protein
MKYRNQLPFGVSGGMPVFFPDILRPAARN